MKFKISNLAIPVSIIIILITCKCYQNVYVKNISEDFKKINLQELNSSNIFMLSSRLNSLSSNLNWVCISGYNENINFISLEKNKSCSTLFPASSNTIFSDSGSVKITFNLRLPVELEYGVLIFLIAQTFFIILTILISRKETHKEQELKITLIKQAMESILKNDFEKINIDIEEINNLVADKRKTLAAMRTTEKLTAIGQTAAMLAHDVRKPFASMKALLANLNFFIKYPDKLAIAQSDLNKTISSVENMIADIMDFSRESKFDLKETDIRPLIESSIETFNKSFDKNKFNIDVKVNFLHSNNPLIEEHKMNRVFQNILTNGFEAITGMGGKVSGEIVIETSENEDSFILKIANDGPKFSKDIEEALFETFFTKGKNSGTGLGLASVKKIIELHGGKITAQNKKNGDGVEFVITLKTK